MTDLDNLKTFFTNATFNDDPKRRNKDTYLIQLDPFHIHPNNYEVNVLKQYKGMMTWNSKLYEQLKRMGANVGKLPSYPFLDCGGYADEFIDIENKRGICMIESRTISSLLPFDITEKKLNLFMSLRNISKNAYGKIPYAGNFYKGDVLSNIDKLQIINEHKFCLCFDDIYHPIWSWDYITNKIIDCFKSKTMPIYYGCYNIEDHIPSNFYIDYRDFDSFTDLNEYLIEFDVNMYDTLVDNAYEWVHSCNLGNVNNFAYAIEKFIKDNK